MPSETTPPHMGMLLDRTSFDETEDYGVDTKAIQNLQLNTPANGTSVLKNGKVRRRMRWRPKKQQSSSQNATLTTFNPTPRRRGRNSISSNASVGSMQSKASLHSFASTQTMKAGNTPGNQKLPPVKQRRSFLTRKNSKSIPENQSTDNESRDRDTQDPSSAESKTSPTTPSASAVSPSQKSQITSVSTSTKIDDPQTILQQLQATERQQLEQQRGNKSKPQLLKLPRPAPLKPPSRRISDSESDNIQQPVSSSKRISEQSRNMPNDQEVSGQITSIQEDTVSAPSNSPTRVSRTDSEDKEELPNLRSVDLRIPRTPQYQQAVQKSQEEMLQDLDDLVLETDEEPTDDEREDEPEPRKRAPLSQQMGSSQTNALDVEHRFSMTLAAADAALDEEDEAVDEEETPSAAYLDAEKNLQAIHDMGIAHLQHNELSEALEVFEEILRGQLMRHGPDHFRVGTALHNIALVKMKQADYREAVKVSREAVRVREVALGPEHADLAVSLAQLGLAYLELGKYKKAIVNFRQALKIRRIVYGPKHAKVAKLLNNIGCALYELTELTVAKVAFEEALEIQRESLKSATQKPSIPEESMQENPLGDDPHTTPDQALLSIASTLCNIGSIKLYWGQYEEASVDMEEALLIQQSVLGDEHPQSLRTWESLQWMNHMRDRINQQVGRDEDYDARLQQGLGMMCSNSQSPPMRNSVNSSDSILPSPFGSAIGAMENLLLRATGFANLACSSGSMPPTTNTSQDTTVPVSSLFGSQLSRGLFADEKKEADGDHMTLQATMSSSSSSAAKKASESNLSPQRVSSTVGSKSVHSASSGSISMKLEEGQAYV